MNRKRKTHTSDRFKISLLRDGSLSDTFYALPGVSLVNAARNAGIKLTTGCLQGRCAICRAQVLDGTFTVLKHNVKNARGSVTERVDGCVLTCCTSARSDLLLAPLGEWSRVPKQSN